MVIKVEVTVNGGGVTALTRDADLFDGKGNFLPIRKPPVIEGSRVKSGDLSWNPLEAIEPPRDIIEQRAVAALLISMRSARTC
jgi:hypothetical protein